MIVGRPLIARRFGGYYHTKMTSNALDSRRNNNANPPPRVGV